MTSKHFNTQLTLVVTALACLAAQPAFAQFTPDPTPIPGVWGPNSNVNDSVVVGDTLFLGGTFDYIGPATSAFATADSADGASMVVAQTPLRDTIAAASDGAGGWFVASRGAGARHLVHLRADGSLDPSFTTPTLAGTAPFDDVRGIVSAAGRVYLFGTFSSVNGVARRSIAALDAASGSVLPWDAQVAFSQANAYNFAAVNGAAVDGNVLYIVGVFDSVGGQPRSGIAAFDADTGALRTTTFANLQGGGVYRLSAAGGRMYVAGGCSPTAGVYPYVCGYESDGTPLTGWGAASTGSEYYGTLLATPTRVYIGANVALPGPNNNQTRVRGFDPVTGAPDGWQSARLGDLALGGYGSADAMVALGGQIFVSGFITSAGGVRRPRFAAFDVATGALTPWHPPVSASATALATDGTRVAILGGFRSAGGRYARHIAALDLRTGAPAAVPLPSIASPVNAFAASGTLVVAGAGPEVVAFNAASGAVQTRFDVSAPAAPVGTVNALAIAEPLLFVGGNFVDVLGQPRQHLAAIDIRTGQPTAFNPRPDAQVTRLRVSSGALYALGPFTSVPGYGRGGIAAWDIATGTLEAFNPPVPFVSDLAFFRDRVFLAGGLGGSNPAIGTAWVDRVTGTPVALGRPAPFTAFAATRTGNTLLAGGYPSPGWGNAGIVAVDGVTGNTLPWQPTIESRTFPSIAHLNATATVVVVVGVFDTAAGVPVHNLAIFRSGRAASPRQMTAAVSNGTVTLGWQPGVGPQARSYVLEAGTTTGASDVGTFAVGTVTRVTGVLAPGTYFIRVRGVGDTGPGPAGSEVIVSVPSTSTPPSAPGPLSASVSAGVVTLSWGAAAGNATSYVIEAGTAAGLTNIGAIPTGNLDTTWSVPAPAGTYVLRVRAANTFGLSAATNEVTVVVP